MSPCPARMWTRLCAAAVLLGAPLLLPHTGGAAPPEPAPADSALALALAGITGESLSLEDAVASGMARSADLRQAEASLREAQGVTRGVRGDFDPELFAGALSSSEDVPSASPFSGADVLRNQAFATSAGARVKLPTGARIEATLTTTRAETNSAFATLSPEYDSAARLDVRQPLLNGFGPSARSELDAVGHLEDAAQSSYDETRADITSRIEETYWDLYAAERDLAAQQVIRNQARSLLAEARSRADAGLVGPSQVATAQVFLAEQEQEVLDREEALDAVSDRLGSLLGRRPAPAFARFRPTDEPPLAEPIGDPDDLVARALERNDAVHAAEAVVASLRARERGARWDAFPSLDFVASIGGNALSGQGREVVFGSDTLRTDLSGGYGDVWQQVRDRRYPTWSAGLELTLPLGLRSGRGDRDRWRAAADAAEQNLVAVRRRAEEGVRASHRELAHGAARLEAARLGVEASQEQVRIGLIEYRSGRSTAFELVRLGADLASAEQRYSQALVRTAKAAARLRHLTGGAYASAGGR